MFHGQDQFQVSSLIAFEPAKSQKEEKEKRMALMAIFFILKFLEL